LTRDHGWRLAGRDRSGQRGGRDPRGWQIREPPASRPGQATPPQWAT